MKGKLINSIILALSLTLGIMLVNTYNNYIKIKDTHKNITLSTNDIDLLDKNIIISKLNNENKMLVLSGETTVDVRYSNEEVSDNDVNFIWIKNWFSKMNSKELIINATYKYQFHYDLKDLDISIIDNKVNIFLSRNRISCNVELIENKSYYSDRIGFLESPFTAQEINSLNARTKELVLNKIQNDNELRDKAIQNVMNNIDELLGIKCNYTIPEYDVVENLNKNILKRN